MCHFRGDGPVHLTTANPNAESSVSLQTKHDASPRRYLPESQVVIPGLDEDFSRVSVLDRNVGRACPRGRVRDAIFRRHCDRLLWLEASPLGLAVEEIWLRPPEIPANVHIWDHVSDST